MSVAAAKRTVLATASMLAIVALSILVPTGGASSARRDSEPPTTPQNVRVAGATQSLVRIAWDPSTDNVGVKGYYVFGDKGKATVDVLDDQGKPILDDDGKAIGDAPAFTVEWLGCGQSTELTVIAFDAAQNRSGKATVTVSTAACTDQQPPTAPSAFTQVATSTDSVVLAWAASSDNVGVVEYGVNRDLQRVATPTQPTVTLTGLSCGSTYQYAVDAADAAGNRSPLAQAFVQTASCPSPSDTISPSTPSGLAASNITETGLTLNWNASSDNVGVTGYDVYRNGTKVASVTSTSANQSGLSCGASYPFGVRARDAAGHTSAAAQLTVSTAACSTTTPPPTDTISPSTPTGLAASNIAQTGLALKWNASSDNVGVTGYDVYRNGARVASVASTTVDQSTLSCGTSYPFAVRALDGAGRTSAAAQLTVSTAACSTTPPPTDTTPPSTPTGLGISSATRTSVSLTWNPSTDNVGVAGYRLYVNGSLNVTTTQPGTTVSNLSCGTSYTLAVDALDAAANNSPQASVTGSTAACSDTQAPTAPTNVVASSRTATSVALSWSASSDSVGVLGYGLYRGGVGVGSTPTTTGIFAGLTCNTNYTLAVDAYDAASNRSAKTTVMVSTTACPDTQPPSTPTGLAASNVTQTSLTLTWNASTDDVGIVGYEVYRGGTKLTTVTTPSANVIGLACGISYTFGVAANDAAGNTSVQSSLQATTSPCSAPPPSPPAVGGSLLPPLGQGSGQAYYVALTGSDSNPGTLDRPWATVDKAILSLKAGETAYVRAGTYGQGATTSLTWSTQGTDSAPATLAAYPGEKPVIAQLIQMRGASLRLTGFTIARNSYPTDSRYGQSGSTPGGNVGLWVNGCSSCQVDRNEIRGNTMSGMFVSGSDRLRIIGNHIHDNGTTRDDHGIYVCSGSDALISDNVIEHNYDFGLQLYCGSSYPAGTTVTSNTIVHNGTAGQGGSGMVLQVSNGRIYNNIIAFNVDYGIRGWASGSAMVANNVVFGNLQGAYYDLSSPYTLSNNQVGNPSFVDDAGRNYRLSSGSPAIGIAVAAYTPTTDFDGLTRPQGGTPDSGAFER